MTGVIWDRTAESSEALSASGCFRFAVLMNEAAVSDRSVICVGLSSDGTAAPDGVTHGFLIDRNNGRFCIVENGEQIGDWLFIWETFLASVEALIFRIYRIHGRVYYTIDHAPEIAYTGTGWEDAQFADWDSAKTSDTEPHSRHSVVGDDGFGWFRVRGIVLQGSDCISAGGARLAAAFSRQPTDPYGENTEGAIYGAVKLAIAGFDSDGQPQPYAELPAIEGAAGDDIPVDVLLELPSIDCTATNYSGSYAVLELPAIECKASDIAVFEFGQNYCYADLPAIEVPDEARVVPVDIPAIVCYAGDGNVATCTLPAIECNAGDDLNGGYGDIPAMTCYAAEEIQHDGAYGQVTLALRVTASSVVTDPSHLPTKKLQVLLGIEGHPYGENELRTAPLSLGLSVAGRVFGERVLPTQPMKIGLAISSSGLFKERLLPIGPLQVVLAANIEAQSEAILQTMPLVFALGGRLGAAAIGRVFCMNAATGGTTEYTGYSFNSVAKIGGRYYGANEQGLFLLEGETDNGTPIAANFGFGQLDFGAAQMKTLSYCYLGTKAGQMRLTIDALVCGKPAQFSYPSRRHGETMRGVRFDLGRGMKSTYVMPTFSNIDGNDFEVDTVRFMAAGSSRRIQK